MVTGGDEAVRLFEVRSAPTRDLAGQADAVAAACHAMAVRFHSGGKLVVFGTGGSSTDAQHVAVEFVHPVIVGKRGPHSRSPPTWPPSPASPNTPGSTRFSPTRSGSWPTRPTSPWAWTRTG